MQKWHSYFLHIFILTKPFLSDECEVNAALLGIGQYSCRHSNYCIPLYNSIVTITDVHYTCAELCGNIIHSRPEDRKWKKWRSKTKAGFKRATTELVRSASWIQRISDRLCTSESQRRVHSCIDSCMFADCLHLYHTLPHHRVWFNLLCSHTWFSHTAAGLFNVLLIVRLKHLLLDLHWLNVL